MRARILMIFVALVLVTTMAAAQEDPCMENILLPIQPDEVPGAYGSMWQTSVTITNHGETPVRVGNIFHCGLGLCPDEFIEPGSTAVPRRVHGGYLLADCDGVSQLDITLRVRDVSRPFDTWGTTTPVVYEEDIRFGEVVGITDVPNTEGIRSMLRVYAVEAGTTGEAQVRIFEINPNTTGSQTNEDLLLADFTVFLMPRTDPNHNPGYAELPLSTLPELNGHDLIRIEVSGPEDLGLWAMVSATSNETQFVTILAPK